MKNGSIKTRFKGLICGILLVLPPATVAQAASVVGVKSSDNTYYKKTIETLIRHTATSNVEVVMAEDLRRPARSASLYVALGQRAADAVTAAGEGVPVINAYLTLEQYHRLPDKRQLTVLLDQPLHRYLAFSKYTLQADSIGIIAETRILPNRSESDLLDRLGLVLNQYQVDPEHKLLPTLHRLLRHNDALLMLPRQSIYNRDSLKGVLLTSYRDRKPVISYSPAHVKSGALASIYSSPVDIGRHLSLLVNNHLQGKPLRGPNFRFARFYSISFNFRVARALGVKLPGETELRQYLDQVTP